jgi:hypothetical protein
MRKTVPIAGFLVAFLILLSGCGAQKGETIFEAGPNSGTVIGKAPKTGVYALYTGFATTPTLTVSLKEGDKLGFRKADDGRIEAVYMQDGAEKTYDLAKLTSQVYWKLLPA